MLAIIIITTIIVTTFTVIIQSTTFLFDHRLKFFNQANSSLLATVIRKSVLLTVLVVSPRLFFIDEISGFLLLKDGKDSILSHFESCTRMD